MEPKKTIEVLAKMDGVKEIHYSCQHFEGHLAGDEKDYGKHNESSNIWIITTIANGERHPRIMKPCKNHLQYYLNSDYWKKYDQ
jgi:hypothetical protein